MIDIEKLLVVTTNSMGRSTENSLNEILSFFTTVRLGTSILSVSTRLWQCGRATIQRYLISKFKTKNAMNIGPNA